MSVNTFGTTFARKVIALMTDSQCIEFSSTRDMNNSDRPIAKEIAPDVFALAARLSAQKNQEFSLEEMMQAGAEAQIPPELVQQALQEIRAKQIQTRERQRNLKLILISGSVGAALALFGLWAYNTVASNFTRVGRSPENTVQTAPISPQPPAPPQPQATFTGEVQQYLFNPEGRVDGLLLNNGTQVKFPPHMTDSLVALVAPGARITVSGNPGVSTSFGQEVKAQSITNIQTGRTLVEQPPAYPPKPPIQSTYTNLSVEGTAQHWLVGHRGEINGVLLSGGAEVKFPPHVGDQLISIAKLGDKIQAQGFGTRNSYGQVLQATSMTVNGQPVSFQPGRA